MKKNIFFFLLCLNLQTKASEILFESEQPEMESNLDVIPAEENVISDKNVVFLLTNYKKGYFHFAPSTKVEAEFNSVSFGLLKHKVKSDFLYCLKLDYMFNKSQSSFTSFLGGAGYNFQINEKLDVSPLVMLGYSYFKEKTNIQDVSEFGLDLELKTLIRYKLNGSASVLINFQWDHIMYSHGYEPKKVDSEMVLEYITTGAGLGWEF